MKYGQTSRSISFSSSVNVKQEEEEEQNGSRKRQGREVYRSVPEQRERNDGEQGGL